MANRARPKTAKKKSAAKGRVPSRGTVATLPRQSKSKRKRGGIGDNSGLHALSDNDVLYHQDQLDVGRRKIKTLAEEMTQLRGVYQSKRKTAKKAGFNLDAYDINVKLENLDMGKVQVDYADAGRYLKVRGSPLAEQLMLFQNMETPAPKVDANLQGQQAGKNAENAENNPFKPGTDEFVSWAEGWATGQAMNADKFVTH